MSSPQYEERQKAKRMNLQYRRAAARLYNIEVPHDEVKRMNGGAFVSIIVWVPLEEAVKESAEL